MDVTSYILAKKYIDELLKNQGSGPIAQEYIDNKIAELVNSAPEMLDTIGELAKAFQDNEEVINALNKAIGNKVDKEDGKGLSSNDFTDELLEKVNNIENLSAKDWNQNDETSFDYIKNRPFYDTEEYEWIEILNNPEIQTNLFFNIIKPSPTLIENEIYKVIFNDNEYICTGRVNAEESSVIIGSENEDFTDNIPFIFDSGSGIGILSVKDELPSNFIIYKKQPIIKMLDRKYINYIPGEITEGKKVLYNNEEYLCDANAEIFNDYLNNIAIGGYSHAEGTYTMAIGTSSHAEGRYTKANGGNSHAEGYMTIASSVHQHVQGQCNIEDTEEKYLHIVGNGKPQNRSNAHTLDQEGNAWFQGDIYVNSTSGINRDEGSKKLATEEYINIRVPAWTAEDEGKVLKIVNGTPAWV